MKHYTKENIIELEKVKRLNIINSITGIKPGNLIGSIDNNKITNLAINNKGLMFTTENELYLRNSDGFTEGFPIESDGYYNIADIDNNGKINLINTKNGFIYNYELKDYLIK